MSSSLKTHMLSAPSCPPTPLSQAYPRSREYRLQSVCDTPVPKRCSCSCRIPNHGQQQTGLPRVSVLDLFGSLLTCRAYRASAIFPKHAVETIVACSLMQFGQSGLHGYSTQVSGMFLCIFSSVRLRRCFFFFRLLHLQTETHPRAACRRVHPRESADGPRERRFMRGG